MKLRDLLKIGAILLLLTSVGNAQKLRFPTNVRYIGGNYIDKSPQFSTLEAALNNVKPYATAVNPYLFWVDSDSLWISDWDSVFTESGLTMKDSIDLYYVSTGKIKWAGIAQGGTGGSGGGTILTLVLPDRSTIHYYLPTWIMGSHDAWYDSLGATIDSVDKYIWELIVYTKGCLEIVDDTLTIDYDCLRDSVEAWTIAPIDSNRTVRKDVNITLAAVYTLTGSILMSGNGYIQIGTVDPGAVPRVLYGSTTKLYYTKAGSGKDSVMFMTDVTSDTSAFSTTDTIKTVTISGATASDRYIVTIRGGASFSATDVIQAIPGSGNVVFKRRAGGTSGLKFTYFRYKR